MVPALAVALVAVSLAQAGWAVSAVVRRVRPSRGQLVGAAVLEGLLLVQALVGTVMFVLTDRDVDAVTFFGYHLTCLALLPLGVGWGIADRSRWGNGVLAITCATEAVLVLRLLQIWAGRG